MKIHIRHKANIGTVIDIACEQCGSRNLLQDVDTKRIVTTKTWAQTFNNLTCLDCGGEGGIWIDFVKAERLLIGEFPGFNIVCLPLRGLKAIIRQQLDSWKTALSNIAGIYLITDTFDGKQYVGCAYGDAGLWQHWSAHAETGHGGNKDLKELLKDKDEAYALHYLFTILEVIDLNASMDYVTARECHWKETLLTC